MTAEGALEDEQKEERQEKARILERMRRLSDIRYKRVLRTKHIPGLKGTGFVGVPVPWGRGGHPVRFGAKSAFLSDPCFPDPDGKPDLVKDLPDLVGKALKKDSF